MVYNTIQYNTIQYPYKDFLQSRYNNFAINILLCLLICLKSFWIFAVSIFSVEIVKIIIKIKYYKNLHFKFFTGVYLHD